MLVPRSWLKEYVDIDDIPVEIIGERLTLAGLEVAHLYYLGVPQQEIPGVRWPKSDHLVWDREKLVLGAIREVLPHPNADRLVLAMVDYGAGEPEQVVTGAPNLFAYRGVGPLDPPLYTGLALEGAEVWDGHSEEPKRMILKGKELRGVYNKSMVCSEKELGLSEEHEGIIILHDVNGHAPGTPLQDVLGDVLLEVELTPNLGRAFSVLGVAREVAALFDRPLRLPSYDVLMEGAAIEGTVQIDIRNAELNPRFTLALLRGVEIKPSPEWMQRRLRLVGQRPINNIVDVTNYITFEIGQPLHAFDYDKLAARAGGSTPTIITRLPEAGETLETLDQIKRELQPHNILVADTAGVLSLGGVIGGAETEITPDTTNVLLEAAAWNFINIRRTMQSQKVFTDAGTRFSRGVHPSQAILGVRRGIELMRQVSGGQVAQGIIDVYPAPVEPVRIDLSVQEIRRIMGMDFPAELAASLLRRLEMNVTVEGDVLHVEIPDYRLDISSDPVIGAADLIEEIARINGYDHIPTTMMEDAMPPQWANVSLEREERARDLLTALGLRENISYRLTTPEREALLMPDVASGLGNDSGHFRPLYGDGGYVELANPIASDKTVLRHSVLVNLLENARANARYSPRQQVFEIGSVYFVQEGQELPDEPRRLGLLMTGPRTTTAWLGGDSETINFYDLKGVVEGLLEGLHVPNVRYARAEHPTFHPGRSARVFSSDTEIGTFGELHPLVAQAFELTAAPVLAAEIDLDLLLDTAQIEFVVRPLPLTPPVLEDVALIVAENVTAAEVEAVIRQAGGDLLKSVVLFDVYRGAPIPAGQKSLAYSLTYQTDDKTLTDKEVAKVRKAIISAAEHRLGATLRA
ncbi:MAG: phenylalanine--tRNA ligase subunit beta [bacterium]|nr:phenylalanine--tRNA ligase subunit beta [bacterium]